MQAYSYSTINKNQPALGDEEMEIEYLCPEIDL